MTASIVCLLAKQKHQYIQRLNRDKTISTILAWVIFLDETNEHPNQHMSKTHCAMIPLYQFEHPCVITTNSFSSTLINVSRTRMFEMDSKYFNVHANSLSNICCFVYRWLVLIQSEICLTLHGLCDSTLLRIQHIVDFKLHRKSLHTMGIISRRYRVL